MKFILNENDELANIVATLGGPNGKPVSDTMLSKLRSYDDDKSNQIIRNNEKYLKYHNDEHQDHVSNDKVTDNLLSVIKRSNDRGYEAFIQGIKSNINNKDFPFTKLMSKPAFSKALGIMESLEEANIFSNVADQIKNSKAIKKLSTFKNKVDPKTFSKFATVYNTILDLKDDANTLIDNPQSVVYQPSLYKLNNYKDIESAIKIDVSAIKNNDRSKHDELMKAIASNKVSQVSAIKSNDSDSDEEIIKNAITIANKNPKAKATLQKGLK